MKNRFSFTKISGIVSDFAGICVVLMMIIGVIDIIGSKIFQKGFPDAVAWTCMLFVFSFAAPLAAVTINRDHVDFDLLERYFNTKVRLMAGIISSLIGITMSAFISWRTFAAAIDAFQRHTSTGIFNSINVWPGHLAISIGFALTTIAYVLLVWAQVYKRTKTD